MGPFTVAIVAGFATGGVFALISLGLVIAFRSTQTLNFAHGQFMLIGALIVGKIQADSQLPLLVIVPFSVATVALLAVVFYLVVLRRVIGLPHFVSVIATLGLAAALDGLIFLIFGSTPYQLSVPWIPEGSFGLFGSRIPRATITVAVVSIAIAIAIAMFIRRTKVGAQLRAAGQDAILASQTGIRVHHVYVGAWAAAGALAAVAGITYGSINSVNSSIIDLALFAFPVILLGGLDSIEGAVVGGVAIGIMQSLISTYLGGQFVTVVTYVLLLVVLLLIPNGLFGSREANRL